MSDRRFTRPRYELWTAYLAAGVLAVALHAVLPAGSTAQDLLYDVIGASAVVVGLIAIRRYRPDPALPWVLLCAGQALFVAGDLMWNYYEFVGDHLFSIKLVLSLLLREEKRPDDVVARIGQLFHVYSSLLADIIETGRQKGIFRTHVDPQGESALIMAALNGILIQSFLQEASLDPAPLLAHLKTSFIERLRP